MSASDDIRFLRRDAIAEGAKLIEMYARHASDFATIDHDDALECALRCMVSCVNATLSTWREMRHDGSQHRGAS